MSQSDKLLKIKEVAEITATSRAGIYTKMRRGEFPRPVQIGERAVAWRLSDIQAWMDNLPVSRIAD